jgi:RND family efflux transporter MFP subunit
VLLTLAGLASADARAQSGATPVVVGQAQVAPVAERLVLSGTTTARRVSMISPLADGLVSAILVDVGDHVEANQVLARFDPVLARHDLATAEASLAEGMAQLREAERRRDEAAEVHAEELIAGTVYESAVAEANVRRAAVARLEAEYERRRELLDRHTVRAPFPGIVARKLAEAGQWAQRSDALLELVDTDVVRVDIPVPQRRFADVGPGTPATVTFDALPDRPVESTVATRLAVGDPAARTFLARIEIPNPDLDLAPGMSARVLLRPDGEAAESVLHVPRDALVRRPDGSQQLWRITGDGDALSAEAVTVDVIRFTGSLAVIAPGGLAAGDRVVIRGNEGLRAGQPVRIIEPPS